MPNSREFGGTRFRDCRRRGGRRDHQRGGSGKPIDAVLGARARLQRAGYVAVGLRCAKGARRACAGKLSLRGETPVGHLGSTRFRIRSGTSAKTLVRLSRRDFRRVKERGTVRVVAIAAPADRVTAARATLTLTWSSAKASRLSAGQRRAALDAMVITERGALGRKNHR